MKTRFKILATLGASLLGLAAPAQAEWQVATAKHFTVYSNDTPANVQAYANSLARFDKAVRVLRGMNDAETPDWQRVRIYVLKDGDELHRMMGEGSENIGGFYRPLARGPHAFMYREGGESGQQKLVLQHEYTHHIQLTTWTGALFRDGSPKASPSSTRRPTLSLTAASYSARSRRAAVTGWVNSTSCRSSGSWP